MSNRPTIPQLPEPDAQLGIRPLVGIESAAKILGVSQKTVTRLMKSGRLRCCRIGARCLFSAAALSDFISDAERAAAIEAH